MIYQWPGSTETEEMARANGVCIDAKRALFDSSAVFRDCLARQIKSPFQTLVSEYLELKSAAAVGQDQSGTVALDI
jgi:hypothetical protein